MRVTNRTKHQPTSSSNGLGNTANPCADKSRNQKATSRLPPRGESRGCVAVNTKPYTIHHTPYTIHHTPYTIHHTPYTIHHTPHTMHAASCTLAQSPTSTPHATPHQPRPGPCSLDPLHLISEIPLPRTLARSRSHTRKVPISLSHTHSILRISRAAPQDVTERGSVKPGVQYQKRRF